MEQRQRGLLLRVLPSADSVRILENRLAVSVLIVAITVSIGNLIARTQLLSESLAEALRYNGVWLTLLSGALIFIAASVRNGLGRMFQSSVVFAIACWSALESTSGNLTSLVFFGLAFLLASQYGLLDRRGLVKSLLLSVAYGTCLAVGAYRHEADASLAAILNLIGAGFIAYLFVVIASLRLREMANRQAELARLVAERTKDLQDEADQRKVAEEEAREIAERNATLAGDREVLLRELHHRSKNDLQMILSLLSLRAEKGDRPELVELFRPTQDRIRTIALVHEQLDGSERFDAVGLRDYLEHLLAYLQISHRDYSVVVQADIDAEVAIKLESATHIGLLVHELVLCSYRYSFEPGASGTISVSARTENGILRISIGDTGSGLPEEIDPAAPDQEEIAIVAGLVNRLSCDLSLDRTPGAGWTACIPLDVVQQPTIASAGQA
ncbi:MAG: hypothetical protein KAU31_15580 [Spirochaetaceae bacterium]|nr:hypothetical protein [Spirochaetaceae bacterium]